MPESETQKNKSGREATAPRPEKMKSFKAGEEKIQVPIPSSSRQFMSWAPLN
jgi:hypothetical protein